MSIIATLEKIYSRIGGPNVKVNLNDFKIDFKFPDNNEKNEENKTIQSESESQSIWFAAMGIQK